MAPKQAEQQRHIRANDPAYNASFRYANNHISTSKYNFLTFIPKNLFEQFQRLANAYFLALLILQLIPQISSLTPLTTVVPLVAVLTATAIKDLLDDIRRHRSDNQVNNRESYVLRNGEFVEERWHKVVVGDIIKMENNQFVAADLFLLSSSEESELIYIETAELDGETNLKVRQCIPDISHYKDDQAKWGNFNGEITCEPPNNNLNKYNGYLNFNNKKFPISNDNMLLRGCVLRNTSWCYGMVVYAGKDSKLMMNSGPSKFKRTHIDRLMNVLIIGIFCFLALMCLICTVACGVWETIIGYDFQKYLPWDDYIPGSLNGKSGSKNAGAAVIALLVFLSYVIILNTVVPISLYVSVEIIRFIHSQWINWDIKLYYEKTNTPALARTTTLNEELGQIEYIFSDKTGTLTQNIMTFNKCTINGISYGLPHDDDGRPMDKPKLVDFKINNKYGDPNFEFYDHRLLNKIKKGDEQCQLFFLLLSLCHTVMAEEEDGEIDYQAQSPDEEALVSAAKNFGFVFKSREPRQIEIEVGGETEIHKILAILDFNNVRKRMSVITEKDGQIRLYCKGADTMIFQRLSPECEELKATTIEHLDEFAGEGLRTLCLAYKDIDKPTFDSWMERYEEAASALENRDELLDEVYEEIEQNMILIGASAIEDKLQDGVPETIANLALADIKIWVLTGDKRETAINIGYSCKLLTDEMADIFVIEDDDEQLVRQGLQNANKVITNYNGKNKKTEEGNHFANPQMNENSASHGGFALVITGTSLYYALQKNMEKLFYDTASSCKAVVCCRVTPGQKALVVSLVKNYKKTITLAIGDGANDVSMIREAHIGVGISGQEGMQAVLASDFSLAQFRFLERLLLVHGRWSYLRMCKFMKYFFYKNFAFTLCHFWFAFFCGFSAQTLFDPFFISFYNVLYTSIPCLALGIFDQDVNERYSLQYPKLYKPGHLDLLFNKKVFAQSVGEGVLSSLILFFIPYGAFHDAIRPNGHDLDSHHVLGVVVGSILIVAMTIRCALDTSYWTGFNHFVIWGSILFYFGFTFLFYIDTWGYSYLGTARQLMSTALYWLTLLLTVVIIILPVIAERFYYIDTRPTLTDKIRLKQKISKSKSASKELTRSQFLRRSNKTLRRSGYAFAHEEGFGKLITSGVMRPSTAGSFRSRKSARRRTSVVN